MPRVRHLLIDEFQDTNPLQWQALARLARQLCRRRRPAAERVHRRRSQAEHLPLPPRRAAGLHRGQGLRARRARRRPAQLRPHAPQCAGGGRPWSTRHAAGAGGGRVRRLPRPHHRIALSRAGAPAAADRCATRPCRRARRRRRAGCAWRDSLTVPRVLPEEQLLQKECAQAARWIAQRIAAGRSRPATSWCWRASAAAWP